MNILVLNGSPRGERSNTLQLARAFVEGFSEAAADADVEIIHTSKLDIKPCLGCFSCWTKTPGQCVIQDEMQTLYKKIAAADVLVESFPLYFFGIPSGFKAVVDRCLPFMKTYLGTDDKDGHSSFHELRDAKMFDKKLVLISTCGYVDTAPMYPALLKQYDLICGEGNYTAILCPEGELFGYEGLAERQKRGYLSDVKAAGAELAELGALSEKTRERLSGKVLSPSGYEAIVRSHWGGEEFPQI